MDMSGALQVLRNADRPLTASEVDRAMGGEGDGRKVIWILRNLEREQLARRTGQHTNTVWHALERPIEKVMEALHVTAGWYDRRDPELAELLRFDLERLRYRASD